jgi:TonB-dependent receptor
MAFLLCLLSVLPARAQQPGQVSGTATEAETGQPLAGAAVTLAGTRLRAVTDASGRFVIAPVPAGSHAVVLTYLGRQAQRRTVTVEAGGAAVVTFAVPAQAITLDGVTVLGMRARTQARALNQQMNAPNIINVVAADQMGRFPDASAPEAVQRVPGVSITRDQGEGRYIQIRGASPAGTQVTLNGVQVPSPEGEVRQIALDAVPVDLLDAIEVSKAILPNMDADAVGGAVNLVTRRAPSGGMVTAEVAGGYSALREEPSYSGALTLGNRWMDGRLGAVVTGSLNQRDFGSDDLEPAYDVGDEGLDDDALEELQVRHYSLARRRAGATANLDYQLGTASSLMLTGVFSQLQDHEQRRNLVNAIEDGELQFLHKNRLEELETYNLTLAGDHTLGRLLRVEHSVAFTRSLEHTPFDNEIGFVAEDVEFDPSLADPREVRANPMAGALDGDFAFDAIDLSRSDTRNTDWVGSLDLSMPLGASGSVLRFGGRLRDRAKLQSVDTDAAELADGADDILLGEQVGGAWGASLRYPGVYRQTRAGTSPADVRDFADRFGASLETERDLEEDTNDYDLDERITAGYLMAEVNLTPRLQLIPGVRYEHTDFASAGFDFDPDAETLTPTSAENDYGTWFPMAHLRWELARGTNVRAAYTTIIARPNFFDLVPYRLRDDEDLALGNPDLDPTTARSFDLLLEHYDSRIGVASVGAYYKRLSDPIFTFVEDNDLGGETEQPRNGEEGTIRGVEVALQRQLSGLPFPFDGLGVYANYTFTDSDARLPGGREVRLQGQAKHVFNTALSYERPRWWIQASVNYHDRYVNEYADDAVEDLFVDRHLQLDASLQARVTETGALFLELVNLTNEPYVVYQGTPDRPVQQEYYRSWGRLGFRISR